MDVDEKEVRVTEWSIEDVEMGDIVVVRCANPGDDIHTLKVDMKDGTREFVWICKVCGCVVCACRHVEHCRQSGTSVKKTAHWKACGA